MELSDKSIKDILAPDFAASSGFNLKSYEKFGIEGLEIVAIKSSGAKIYLKANISPVFINNRINYFNIVLTDITKKKSFQKDLHSLSLCSRHFRKAL